MCDDTDYSDVEMKTIDTHSALQKTFQNGNTEGMEVTEYINSFNEDLNKTIIQDSFQDTSSIGLHNQNIEAITKISTFYEDYEEAEVENTFIQDKILKPMSSPEEKKKQVSRLFSEPIEVPETPGYKQFKEDLSEQSRDNFVKPRTLTFSNM